MIFQIVALLIIIVASDIVPFAEQRTLNVFNKISCCKNSFPIASAFENRDNGHLRFIRDTSDDVSRSSSQSVPSSEDLSTSGNEYHYYPYLRVRHIQKIDKEPPLSNYADSYDKFPTDF